MNFIAIECSTSICSMSSFHDNKLINVIDSDDGFNHSESLPIFYKSIAQDFKSKKRNIDYFVISIGPGSFTSLRISLSFVKGLAFANKIPILPVQSLISLNLGATNLKKHYIVIDSYKDKCFIQKFDNHRALSNPSILKISNLKNLKHPVYGFSKNIKKSNYIKPSSLLVGEYIIRNHEALLKKYKNDITPIYLSNNIYKKMDDN